MNLNKPEEKVTILQLQNVVQDSWYGNLVRSKVLHDTKLKNIQSTYPAMSVYSQTLPSKDEKVSSKV